MGSHVTNAVRKNIADVDCFIDEPEILLYGMSCVIWVTGIWLLFASYWGMPVSTTHSTIGSIIGIAITFKGSECVVWHEEIDKFPYIKGLSAILSS
jgi:solute carrier family 20 (sodium-dependent phosphate transporter)